MRRKGRKFLRDENEIISNLTVLKLKKTVHFPLIITSPLLILITNFELAACLTFPLDHDTSGN